MSSAIVGTYTYPRDNYLNGPRRNTFNETTRLRRGQILTKHVKSLVGFVKTTVLGMKEEKPSFVVHGFRKNTVDRRPDISDIMDPTFYGTPEDIAERELRRRIQLLFARERSARRRMARGQNVHPRPLGRVPRTERVVFGAGRMLYTIAEMDEYLWAQV